MTDYISRADIPYHTQLEPMGNGQYSDVEVAYKTDIDALPSAEAVHIETYRELYEKYVELKHASADRPQGEWKHVKSTVKNDNGYLRIRHLWECSVCDFQGEYTWHYCPNCGARMEATK